MSVNNPCAQRRPFGPHNGNMGRQSQQRVSNTKRTYNLASNNNSFSKRPKKGGQLKIGGGFAFDSLIDCKVCVAMEKKKTDSSVNVPHKPHHVLCIKNSKTCGKGDISVHMTAVNAEEKCLKQLYSTPLAPHEKASSQHATTAAAEKFFSAKKAPQRTLSLFPVDTPPPINFSKLVSDLTSSPRFQEKHKAKGAPLAMIAFAFVARDEVMASKAQMKKYFDGITITVPECSDSHNNPCYHSITGNKLLLVDWSRMCGVQVPCVDANCCGTLNNDRTNFSLFPIFSLEDSPSWCMVQSVVCSKCKRRFDANDSSVLKLVPPFASQAYPVDTKYAINDKACHLSRTTTEVFDNIIMTHANGELCSRLLYNALNRSHANKVLHYYSYLKFYNHENPLKYIEKDGVYVRTYPPQGDTIRDMFDQASKSKDNLWGISDFERHTREIQSVQCNGGIFAQDHTFEVVKNYPKSLGAKALWDVATDTGEIACAVLVPTCQTKDFSHAARALVSRKAFTPQVMYTDTWPHKQEYWQTLVPGLQGRLGLFHFEKRILSTLRKHHIDYMDALTALLFSLYSYSPEDYEKLLVALKNGSLSPTGKMYSSTEITNLKDNRTFHKRCGKYLRKTLLPPETMVLKIDDWFNRFKATSSDPLERPAGGRLDPVKGYSLFTQDTKIAVENCKEKAKYLSDPFPIEKMYDVILPSPNTTHNLTEYISRRGESKLESFHDRMRHFANTGMRPSLADNLNLMGTARFNLSIRHKRLLIVAHPDKPKNPNQEASETRSLSLTERTKIPASWEKVVPHWNHSELHYINQLARRCNVDVPFPHAETLPPDNGERFFSAYLVERKKHAQKFDDQDLCLCETCQKLSKREGDASVKHSNQSEENITTPTPTTTNNATTTTPPATTNAVAANAVATNAVALARQRAGPSLAEGRHPPSVFNNNIGWYNMMNGVCIAPHVAFPVQPPFQMFGYSSFLPAASSFAQQHLPSACCAKYNGWLASSRVGRPPHDAHCGARQLQISRKQQHRQLNGRAPKCTGQDEKKTRINRFCHAVNSTSIVSERTHFEIKIA